MEKYQNKYRIPSARLQNWDYGWNGAYFITICTHDRQHYFGKINDGKMELSSTGILADVFWHEIKTHTKNVELDAFVVMPNHIHGIIILNGNDNDGTVGNDGDVGNVETRHALSLQSQSQSQSQSKPQSTIGQQRFQNQGKNTISSIIGSYKSAVTKHARRLGFAFKWQTRFHDHIIRNYKSFIYIQNYIINNPMNWEEDKFFKQKKYP